MMNDTLTHKEAFELLPWYVNGTLAEDERRDVRGDDHHLVAGAARLELPAPADAADLDRAQAPVDGNRQ